MLCELSYSLCQYAVQFLGNMGNYKSFGDTKFIPRLSPEQMDKIVEACGNEQAKKLYRQCKDGMFSLEPDSVLMLGFPDKQVKISDLTSIF